jgi:subtilase family serine protease
MHNLSPLAVRRPSSLGSGRGVTLPTRLTLALVATLGVTASIAPVASARPFKAVCGVAALRHARCNAEILTTSSAAGAAPLAAKAPSGYGPADLQSAYGLAAAAASAGAGQTVAIVDAMDDPNAEADLGVYRSQFGLAACTTANGCFRKVGQTGTTTYPKADSGWAQEISLDLDMVSAVCPKCHILLVEATSTSIVNLGTAVNRAVTMGATQVSNSYGGNEYSTETTDQQSYYNHPGVDITVSSGDDGYGVEFPAASQYVTAVGGTSLTASSAPRGWSETVWSGAGSGCSKYIAKPAWQKDTGCARRTVADVSAVADPNTGVAVYDSYQSSPSWLVFGGTSVASPLVAAVDALAGGRASATPYGSFAYANLGAFNDVLSGSNGSCSGSYLCTGTTGYDGPTGVGTPNGTGTAPPAPVAPVNTAAPTISGTPTQNQVLSASTGTWTGSPAPTYTYQWNRCAPACSAIAGATGATYTLGSADVTHTVSVSVTATNTAGSATSTSAAVGPIASVPVAPGDFSLSASPASQTVARSATATYVVTVKDVNGFNKAVSLTLGGLPSGATASFSPASATTSSTLTVHAPSSAPLFGSTSTLTITGTSGTLVHSTTVSLHVRGVLG